MHTITQTYKHTWSFRVVPVVISEVRNLPQGNPARFRKVGYTVTNLEMTEKYIIKLPCSIFHHFVLGASLPNFNDIHS